MIIQEARLFITAKAGYRLKISFGTIKVTPRSKKIISEILKTERLSCGKYVDLFERKFASLIGTKSAVSVGSGTDALVLALAVMYDYAAKRGDEVILPALSFVATGNAVLEAGFKPVFVDVKRQTLNIDPARIEKVITKRTKAILPVHLMGKPAEMDFIKAVAKKHKLLVIEDAAEAHGAVYKGRNVGSIGDMAGFSLYVAHIISTVEGGIVTTNNSGYDEIIRSLRSHGRACKCRSCLLNTKSAYCPRRFNNKNGQDIRFLFERAGFSSKMNELEAAVGIGNLDLFDDILKKRRKNLYYLMDKIRQFSRHLVSIDKLPYEEIGPHALPIVIQEKSGFSREQYLNFLCKNGIDARTLFSCIPTQCSGFTFLGYKPGDFPNAEYIGNNGIHIGVHQDMGKRECDYFLDLTKKFVSQY